MSKANLFNHGLQVLVARPENKGLALVNELKNAGIQAQHCELFSYQLVDDTATCKKELSEASTHILIFISVASVQYAARVLEPNQWRYQHIIAIGKATKAALLELGMNAISPTIETSEGLLSLPLLHTENVANQRIIIVRGDKGRELIFNTLIDRKANIRYAKSYQRQWHITPQQSHIAHYVKNRINYPINCIVVTSVAILEAMLNILTKSTTVNLNNDIAMNSSMSSPFIDNKLIHWVVASERIALKAEALGIKNIINANSANNQCLISTLIDLNNHLLETNNDR